MIKEKCGNFFVLTSDNHVEGKKCMYLLLKSKSYVQTDATTPNIVGPTILEVVARRFRYVTDQFNDQLPVGLLAELVKALHRYRVGQDPVKPGF